MNSRRTSQFKGLGASGLPVVDSLHRDQAAATLTVKGAAAASGLPTSLSELSLTGQSDLDEIAVKAARDQASDILALKARAQTQIVAGGKKQKADSALQVRWGAREVTLDQILVALVPVVGPGGQFLPSDPSRWSGTGKYDVSKDELIITADAQPFGAGVTPLAISPTQIRAGGLKTRDAAWIDVNLTGDLPALANLAGLDQAKLAGSLGGRLQGRQNASGWDVAAGVQVRDLAQLGRDGARTELARNASASVRGAIAGKLERFDIAEMAVVTPYGQVTGTGPVTDLTGTPHLDLHGTLSPDWKAISDLLAQEGRAARVDRGFTPSLAPCRHAAEGWQQEPARGLER